MKTNFPLVSIAIPTLNRTDSLKKTIDSIYAMDYPKEKMEIIIIDGAQSNDTQLMLQKYFPEIKLIKETKKLGTAPAENIGLRSSTGKYTLITNDDVLFDKACLKEMVRLIESDSRIGIVTGKMFFQNTNNLAITGFRVNIWLGYHPYDFEGYDTVKETDIATGGCMFIRKSIISSVGMFDEGYIFCGEEYDYCFRVKIAGYKIMYCPTAILWHELLSTSKNTNNYKHLFAHYRGKFRFMLVHANLFQLLFFFPVQFFYGPVYCYRQSWNKTLHPMFTALFWNINNLKDTLKSRQQVNKLRKRSAHDPKINKK